MENTLSFNGDFYFSLVSLRTDGELDVELHNKEIKKNSQTEDWQSLSVFLC